MASGERPKASQETIDPAVQNDRFGPAVVVEISAAAADTQRSQSLPAEERIKQVRPQYIVWATGKGMSEAEIETNLGRLEVNMRANDARWALSRAANEKSLEALRDQQPNMEEALDRAEGVPPALLDAMRAISTYRYDAGSAGSSVGYDDPDVRRQIRELHGEEALQGAIARGKAYDAAATLRAHGSAAALGRFGLEGSAFTMTNGHFKMSSFTLGKIDGGYSITFEPETSAFKVMKQGEDITSAIFNGTAFLSRNTGKM